MYPMLNNYCSLRARVVGVATWVVPVTSGSYCVCMLGKMSGEVVQDRAEPNGNEDMDTNGEGGELTFHWRELGN